MCEQILSVDLLHFIVKYLYLSDLKEMSQISIDMRNSIIPSVFRSINRTSPLNIAKKYKKHILKIKEDDSSNITEHELNIINICKNILNIRLGEIDLSHFEESTNILDLQKERLFFNNIERKFNFYGIRIDYRLCGDKLYLLHKYIIKEITIISPNENSIKVLGNFKHLRNLAIYIDRSSKDILNYISQLNNASTIKSLIINTKQDSCNSMDIGKYINLKELKFKYIRCTDTDSIFGKAKLYKLNKLYIGSPNPKQMATIFSNFVNLQLLRCFYFVNPDDTIIGKGESLKILTFTSFLGTEYMHHLFPNLQKLSVISTISSIELSQFDVKVISFGLNIEKSTRNTKVETIIVKYLSIEKLLSYNWDIFNTYCRLQKVVFCLDKFEYNESYSKINYNLNRIKLSSINPETYNFRDNLEFSDSIINEEVAYENMCRFFSKRFDFPLVKFYIHFNN